MKTNRWLLYGLPVLILVIVAGIAYWPVLYGVDSSRVTVEEKSNVSDTPQSELIEPKSELIPSVTPTSLDSNLTPSPGVMATTQPISEESVPEPTEQPVADIPNLRGVVRNTQRDYLAGAVVEVSGYEKTVTDSNGAFRIEGISEDRVSIQVSHEGYYPLEKPDVAVTAEPISLVLVREGTLAGIVVDGMQKPIVSAEVRIQAVGGIWIKVLTSDSEGRFVLESPASERVQLKASRPGYRDGGGGTREVEIPQSEVVMLQLEQQLYSISGRVVRRDTQEGLAGCVVAAQPQRRTSQPSPIAATTNDSGEFKIENLSTGLYVISGGGPSPWMFPASMDRQHAIVIDRDVNDINFEAVMGLDVSGVVQTNQRQPVADAQVSLEQNKGIAVRTNSAGQYQLVGVPGSRVLAEHPQYGTGLSEPIPEDTQKSLTNVDITLQPPGSLFGSVKDANGAALAGAVVSVRDRSNSVSWKTQSNEEGLYSLDEIPLRSTEWNETEAMYVLEAMKEGYSRSGREVTLHPGEINTVDFVLEAGGSIAGRVTDTSGKAVEGVEVRAYGQGGESITATSDADGFYTLQAVPAGTFDLLFRLDTIPALTASLYRVPTNEMHANAVLSTGEWIVTGSLSSASSNFQVKDVRISIEGTPLTGGRYPFVWVERANAGMYYVRLAEPAQYRLTFFAERFEPVEKIISITEDSPPMQREDIMLRASEGVGTITGVFSAPPGASLTQIEVAGVGMYPVQGGMFLLDRLPVGRHNLIFYLQNAEMLFARPVGALSIGPVQANETLDLGPITLENLMTSWRGE